MCGFVFRDCMSISLIWMWIEPCRVGGDVCRLGSLFPKIHKGQASNHPRWIPGSWLVIYPLLLCMLVDLMVCGARSGLRFFLVLTLRKLGLQCSMQVAFTCVVYPSLLLGYIGQAAYLSKNLHHVKHGFFYSIPSMLNNYLYRSPIDCFHYCKTSATFFRFEYAWGLVLTGWSCFVEPVFWPVFISGTLLCSQLLPCRYVLHFLIICGVSLVCGL